MTKLLNLIFQTKKRYCGYMYETRDQEKPEFLAKGIETVRRDGCPAVSKVKKRSNDKYAKKAVLVILKLNICIL